MAVVEERNPMGKKRNKQNGFRSRNYNKPRKRLQNARYDAPAGAGRNEDRGREFTPQPPKNQRAMDRIASDLYFTDWQSAKIITIPVDDALRSGWQYEGISDEEVKTLEEFDQSIDVLNKVKRGMIIERLLGGAVILMGIKDQEDKPELPLNIEAIEEGDLTFMNVIPRHRVHLTKVNQDPLSPGFGKPMTYTINGHVVHESRLLIFDGDPLSYTGDDFLVPRRGSYQLGFGQSVLTPIIDDLARATGTRQAAFHLVNMASVLIAGVDMNTLSSTKQGDAVINELQDIYQQISVYKMALMDKGIGDSNLKVEQLTASFGSVPELLMSFLQVLSAASGITSMRFLGEAPGGLNATGKGELEIYYGSIENERIQKLKPQLDKYVAVSARSNGVPVPEITFEPLWTLSESENATIRQIDGANIINLEASGIITSDEARDEAKERGIISEHELDELDDEQDILDELNRQLDLNQGAELDNAA